MLKSAQILSKVAENMLTFQQKGQFQEWSKMTKFESGLKLPNSKWPKMAELKSGQKWTNSKIGENC